VKNITQAGNAICCFVWAFVLLCSSVLASAQGVPSATQQNGTGGVSATASNAIGQFRSGTNNISHVLEVNDLIKIEVYKEEDLRRETRIDQDGTISLALIQEVKVAGRTIAEARDMVKTLYERDYLVNADVAITLLVAGRTNTVVAAPKLKFQITGEVKKPGIIEIPEGEKVDLVQAIGLGGDFTPLANKSSVKIRRTEGGKEKVYDEDVKKMLDGKIPSFRILPGDVITVRQTVF